MLYYTEFYLAYLLLSAHVNFRKCKWRSLLLFAPYKTNLSNFICFTSIFALLKCKEMLKSLWILCFLLKRFVLRVLTYQKLIKSVSCKWGKRWVRDSSRNWNLFILSLPSQNLSSVLSCKMRYYWLHGLIYG